MIASESAVTVQEVSMQEWAMLAFHAERAPRRVRVTISTPLQSPMTVRSVARE